MTCGKCKQGMRLKYVMNTDGTFKAVWACPNCKHQEHAIGRNC